VAQDAAPFHWRGPISAGSTLEIRGVNGDVIAEPASGAEVEVTAVRRGRRNDPESVRIEMVPSPQGLTFCAVYPSPDSRPNECLAGGGGRNNVRDNDVTVRFTVRVPRDVRFVGRTVNGDVEAKQLNGPVDVSTVNGSVVLDTSSYGRGSTVNGSVNASLGRYDWDDSLAFKTVNGSITLRLPNDIHTDVQAATVNGDINTDFPLTITGRFGPRRVNGTIGNGGRKLELETVNGSITLKKHD
jgi:hypothetical protein